MMTKNISIKTPSFFCEKCDFVCSNKSDYERHLLTRKHNNDDKKAQKNVIKNVCICGKSFKYRQGLFVHHKTCMVHAKKDTTNDVVLETKIKEKIDSATDKELKDLVKDLINQNSELMKTINSIIPKIGNTTNNNTNNNTTNNFNLNVFLNEQCKDALNISDFIDSLKITLEDLLFSKTNGITRGITDVLIKGLRELDIHKRPIHCTDIKRDIMYIKDEDKWQKDENHEMMKNTIVKIADKERTALQQWAIDNPDWIETERKQIEYLTMMRSICEPIENYNNYERKIIKNLGKEILIDKKM